MAYQEVTRTGYGDRLKKALGGVVGGFVMFIGGTAAGYMPGPRSSIPFHPGAGRTHAAPARKRPSAFGIIKLFSPATATAKEPSRVPGTSIISPNYGGNRDL